MGERVGIGTRLPVAGEDLTLAAARVRSPRREGEVLLSPDGRPAAATAACLRRWRATGWPRRRTAMRRALGGATARLRAARHAVALGIVQRRRGT